MFQLSQTQCTWIAQVVKQIKKPGFEFWLEQIFKKQSGLKFVEISIMFKSQIVFYTIRRIWKINHYAVSLPSRIWTLPVFEYKTGCHFFTHTISCGLIEPHPECSTSPLVVYFPQQIAAFRHLVCYLRPFTTYRRVCIIR